MPRFFLALMIGATIMLAFVLAPLAKVLVVAGVFAAVLWPLQRWLTKRIRGRRGVAAGLLTFAVVVLLLGPVATIVTFIVADGAEGVEFISNAARSDDVAALVDRLPASARDTVKGAIERLPHDVSQLMDTVEGHESQAYSTVGKALVAGTSLAFQTVMMLIALFFLLVRGGELVGWLESVSPLGRGQTNELFTTFRKVSYSVIVSTGVTAAVQAVAALGGYLIAQVPNPFFFALLTFFCAFIPAIGAGVVCLFAALLLLVTGHPYMALFLGVWGLVVVGLVDNLVKPLLIRRGIEIHGAIVFFSLIGGIAAFGAIGLLLGPLAISLFLAVLRMYHRDYTPGDSRVPGVPGLPAETEPPVVPATTSS